MNFGKPGTGEGEFKLIDGVWVDPRGRILVTDKGNDRVYFFSREGKYLGHFGSPGTGPGEFKQCTGVVVDSLNRIIISDQNNARIQVFDLDGKFLTAFGEPGTGDGQFIEPMGLALDKKGFLYVADGTRDDVQVFDKNFNFLRKFGREGFTSFQMKGIESIAVSANGDVYVADEMNLRIHRFNPIGVWAYFVFSDPGKLIAATLLIFLCLAGAYQVSYSRARGEGLGLSVTAGCFGRAERIILLGTGSLLAGLLESILKDQNGTGAHIFSGGVLLLLGIGSHLTAWNRMIYLFRNLDRRL